MVVRQEMEKAKINLKLKRNPLMIQMTISKK
jgi:hypothetical protein